MIARFCPLMICLALLAVAPAAFAQFEQGLGGFGSPSAVSDPVTFSTVIMPATADRPAVLAVTADIAANWHVYSLTQPKGGPLKTTIKLDPSQQYKLAGEWAAHPQPHSRVDDLYFKGLTVEEHEGKVTWYVPIELTAGVNAADVVASGKISLQACEAQCIPINQKFTAKVGEPVEIGEVRVAATAAAPPATLPNTTLLSPSKEAVTPPATAGVYRANESEITWYGWVTAATANSPANLFLQAQQNGEWQIHAYAPGAKPGVDLPTVLGFDPQSSAKFGTVKVAANVVKHGESALGSYDGNATWQIPLDTAGGSEIRGQVGYQACSSTSCEMPLGARFVATVPAAGTTAAATVDFTPSTYNAAVALAAATPEPQSRVPVEPIPPTVDQTDAGASAPAAPSGRTTQIEFGGTGSTSLVSTLLAAVLGGLILNLMPCVLPVIGLKVLSFAKQGGENRVRVIGLNLAYVAGLLTVFLLLATLAALPQLGLYKDEFNWGELNTHNEFKVGMTALVFAMALSFLGVWEIPIPGFAGGRGAAHLAAREGYPGAFAKGVFTTILATPCSGPFLGPVLGYTISQPPLITYTIFLAIGLGMALPYLLIALFPSLVRWIPKPGAWMETFKQFMAFLLLGTVVYLFSTISESRHVATLSVLVAIWFACWWVGRTPLTASTGARYTAWIGGIGVATVIGLASFEYLVPTGTDLPWQNFAPNTIAESQRSGKTVLVDFTARWCPTCIANMETVIDTPRMAKIVEANGVEVQKADWSDLSDEISLALEELRSRSIPLLAIYPANRPNEVIVLRDLITRQQLLRALALAGANADNPEADFQAENVASMKPVVGAR